MESRAQAHKNKRCGGIGCYYCENQDHKSATKFVVEHPIGTPNRKQIRKGIRQRAAEQVRAKLGRSPTKKKMES